MMENETQNDFTKKSLPLEFAYPISILNACSVTVCIIILVMLLRSRSGNFFQWKIVDRFILYTVVCDLLFYAAQIAVGVYNFIYTGTPEGALCSLFAICLLEFAYAQEFMTVAMACYVFSLMVNKRHLQFGRFDWRLNVPCFGIPLIVLIAAVCFDQLQPNIGYCSYREEQGFLTWHFFGYFLAILLSFLIITLLYLIIWCHVRRHTTKVSTSAVSLRRLAFKLSLFVLVYVLQFGGNAVEGFWVSIEPPPMGLRYAAITSSVAGGVFNGFAYLTIRRSWVCQKKKSHKRNSTDS